MATNLDAGNDFLSQMPNQPVRDHWNDNAPESSPPTTTTPVVHEGADPDAAAHGTIA